MKHSEKKPNSSAAKEKMKSEWTSGSDCETLFPPIPCPKNPPLIKESIDLLI